MQVALSIVIFAVVFPTIQSKVNNIPSILGGTWSGNVTASPFGPWNPEADYNYSADFLYISSPDSEGNVYFKHPFVSQLFRIQGTNMQYCFANGTDTAPFMVNNVTDHSVQFCWRGDRLPSQAANCSTCDCADWSLTLNDDGSLSSKFQMSPPALHMDLILERVGEFVPEAALLVDGWPCEFENHTGAPTTETLATGNAIPASKMIHPAPKCSFSSVTKKTKGCPFSSKGKNMPMGSKCPFSSSRKGDSAHIDSQPSVGREADEPPKERPMEEGPYGSRNRSYSDCLILNSLYDVRFEYTAAEMPCTPCDVTWKFSMLTPGTSETEYIALGFKGEYEAYREDIGGDDPDYWGMSTSDAFSTQLSDRIILGYISENRTRCVRQMKADAYVGSIVDVEADGFIRDARVTKIGRRVILRFTTSYDAGVPSLYNLNWREFGTLGIQRVMYGAGPVDGDGGCSASLGYHDGVRASIGLAFPGLGQECTLKEVKV